LRVAIIGGAGRMGRLFARYFHQRGDEVIISDIDEEKARIFADNLGIRMARNNMEAAESAELIMVCTPIETASTVINDLLGGIRGSAVLTEISSVKSPVMPVMRKAVEKGLNVLSVHPLFGPGVKDVSGERIAVVPVEDEASEIGLARRIFPDMRILSVDFERHDYVMALTLSLTHFMNMAFASVLADEDLRELKSLGGTTFRMQMMLIEGMMTEDPGLFTSIQMCNPYTIRQLQRFLTEAIELIGHIQREERGKLGEFYDKVFSALSKHGDLAGSYEAMYKALRIIEESCGDNPNP